MPDKEDFLSKPLISKSLYNSYRVTQWLIRSFFYIPIVFLSIIIYIHKHYIALIMSAYSLWRWLMIKSFT